MAKKKEPNYFLWYFISMLLTLIIHYFVLAKLELHSTIHVFFSFLLFTVLMGVIVTFIERKVDKK